jgi:hypothetical protein
MLDPNSRLCVLSFQWEFFYWLKTQHFVFSNCEIALLGSIDVPKMIVAMKIQGTSR